MKILGIRNAPTKIRFCVIDVDGVDFDFSNAKDENLISLPKSLVKESELYEWIKSEYSRIFHKYGPFDHMAIKQNENVSTRYSRVKPVMFMDCIATIVAIENKTEFSFNLYANIGTNKKGILKFAESKADKSELHWNTQMADAISAAILNAI
tara:strand:+ start:621 stop:1076 length:456 start_codon:yes stop_codon:yes gene_type:complete